MRTRFEIKARILSGCASSICVKCRKTLQSSGPVESSVTDKDFEDITEHLGALNLEKTEEPENSDIEVTPILHSDKRRESIFIPDVEESPATPEQSNQMTSPQKPDQSLVKLNDFLVNRDVSPVRYTLCVPWDNAHERTNRRYTRKARQSVHEVLEVIAPERITQQYIQLCTETGFTPMSKRTQLRVLDACSASVRKSLRDLDNFSAQGSNAFDYLCETVDRIAEQVKSQAWAKETKQSLRDAKQYLRADYKVHVAMESNVPDHCQSFALSDPGNGQFQRKCNHDHAEICCECYKLNEVLADIEIACTEVVSEEEREDTMCMFQQGKEDIMAWKAHQLRSVNQDQAKFDVLDILNRSTA
ncbi:hypothetical protein ACROYT_G021176 [Oculina patagonica]